MNKLFYPRLAADNIKKNSRSYLPYILTCIITAAMFYIMCSLSANEGINKLIGADVIVTVLNLGRWVVAIFALIFLFYANSFLIKRRKKEFGLFNILGMEKKHLARVIIIETLYIWLITLAAGIGIGIVLDKLMYLLLLRLISAEISLGFYLSGRAMVLTALLFTVIFLLIFINSVLRVHLSKPIELLMGGNVGEKEPKTKVLMTILGVLCLSGGYYISLTAGNPVQAIMFFFAAVIMVIIGTYLLFIAGSVAVLKILRKNKAYYYRANHFISISGMLYRMKQNAVGLASICILSTMVLVMISSTASLIIGVEDAIRERVPNDFKVEAENIEAGQGEKIKTDINNILAENGAVPVHEISYNYLGFAAAKKDNTFQPERQSIEKATHDLIYFFVIPVNEFNQATGRNSTLTPDQIMIFGNRNQFDDNRLEVLGKTYEVKEELKGFPGQGLMTSAAVESYFVVVDSVEEQQALYKRASEDYEQEGATIWFCYGFDLDQPDDVQLELTTVLKNQAVDYQIEGWAENVDFSMILYGGLFFLGIFLGTLFVIATVLIIYYKQITEGYEDKERYEILQKVGMNQHEVKKTIRSQIVTVFFLPLLVAGMHIIFAFPIIRSILQILYLTNVKLFVMCTVGCYIIFAAVYAMIFMITSRSYYRIVKR